MDTGVAGSNQPRGLHESFALFGIRADGKHAGIDVNVVQGETLSREPIN